jgi:hypothetical protein
MRVVGVRRVEDPVVVAPHPAEAEIPALARVVEEVSLYGTFAREELDAPRILTDAAEVSCRGPV